ncbi:MAG: PEP-CTERM sorting domain-containing protein [Candidatus Thiodiazotropha sp.]
MYIKGTTFLCLGIISLHLNATVIYNDGGAHTINSFIYDNVVLENHSDLNIEHGGFIISPGSDYAVYAATSGAGVNGSSVNMSGDATVIGGVRMNGSDSDASSVVTRDDSTIQGLGAHPNGVGRAAVSGAHYVEINDNSHIVGATSGATGGAAIKNGDSGHYHVTVNGGEVVGGHGGNTGGYGISADFDPIALEITGGVIRGGDGDLNGGTGVVNTNYGTITMTDGAIYGGDGGISGGTAFYSFADMEMDIYGGLIQGGNGGAYGGSAIRTTTTSGEPAHIQIFDGQFDAGIGSIVDGWIFDVVGSGSNMSLYGGQIGYTAAGAGINIDINGLVDVYGWDLRVDGDLLTGYLLDGSWIETAVSVAGITLPGRGLRLFNHENVNVPEPSVLQLMLFGLAGLGFRRFKMV